MLIKKSVVIFRGLHRSNILGAVRWCSSDRKRTKLSYSSGPSTIPLLSYTAGQALDISAEKWPNREACVFMHQNIRKTYEQFKQQVDDLACGLIELGFEPGDRIGLFAPNIYEWLLTMIAAFKAGLILVLVNPAYMTSEVEMAINKVRMKGIICAESFKHHDYYKHFQELIPDIKEQKPGKLNSQTIPSLKNLIIISEQQYPGAFKFKDLLQVGGKHSQQKLQSLQDFVQFNDICNIQFTSGTTGTPKGVQLTHHNLINNANLVGYHFQYHKKHHRLLVVPPLYHCFGCVVGGLSGLLHGGTFISASAGFDPEAAIKAVEKERCSSIYGTPTMFVDMLHYLQTSNADMSSLETGAMAGAPCPEQLVSDVINKMGVKEFMVVYGLTETSPVITTTERTDSPQLRSQTVGRAMDHTEICIVDENDKAVPRGKIGEICSRGYTTFRGYWEQPDKTAEAITTSNWFKTGDLGYMNENGTIQISGRLKDMVIRGGENIYPREVEEFLHTHPDIIEVYVFGVPDQRLGEELCAWVRCHPDSNLTEPQIREFCKGQISHFKIPRYIMFRDDYPRTISGKIQKFKMRDESIKELGL